MPGASCWYKGQHLLAVMATEWEHWGTGGGWGQGWWKRKDFVDGNRRERRLYIYINFGWLSGSLCWEGAETGGCVNHKVITLLHTHCGASCILCHLSLELRLGPRRNQRAGGQGQQTIQHVPTSSSPTFTFGVFRLFVRANAACSRRTQQEGGGANYPSIPPSTQVSRKCLIL